ncbi:hypothetical protein [Paraburkholderia domus]|uniref:hypothetical protein n=1 Tax=Paraburkholderia domus TaxID=2793075 RepID=UPI00191412B2|nr:hypothetical protein [Paraburkholderia domus]MBK5061849.1 hypothetical protein [Burkholderia sp. R-70199]CAE6901605.1 hypothetical protein R70199_03729 [Paraburkholderia domus]
MLRDIRTHETDALNQNISILVLDDPDPVSRASHCYSVAMPGKQSTLISFQHGNPSVEINGLTNEVLLAIMADRLAAFQTGPFACRENADMLKHIEGALSACGARAARVAAEQN